MPESTGLGAPHDVRPPADPVLAAAVSRTLGRGVRTPLHSILGFLELLSMSDLDSDQRHLLEEVLSGADALVAATDRALVLIGTVDGQTDSQDVDLSALLQQGAGSPVRADGAAVTVRAAPDLPRLVRTDPRAVRHLLAELVDNALCHGRPPVTVTAERADPTPGRLVLRLTVRDGGPGLPAEVSDALDRGLPAPHGIGVGLLLAQRLAAALGGRLSVVDGSVSLLLPVADVPDPAAAAPAAPAVTDADTATDTATNTAADPDADATARPVSLRILLAEDNAVNRLLAQRQLGRLGHELTTVATGLAAVEAAAGGGFDVVLLDRHLPDIDGLEVARRLRTAEGGATRTPILAVTADASPRARQECLAAGMDGYLTKPLDLDSLAAALAPYAGADQAAPRDVAALAAYLSELTSLRLRISAAARRGTLPAMLAAAETLRDSSAAVGAHALAGACGAVADAAGAGDLDAARRAGEQVPALCDQVRRTLGGLAPRQPTETVPVS